MAEVGVLMDPNENWNPTDWASADARAEIKGNAQALLKRGIDINANAEINVSVAAHIAKFLALDVSAGAGAKIELKAQAQILLDLFDEVGVAIRLRAEAELAAFINVGIGINAKDFLELAGKNPIMMKDPVQMELLKAILYEAKFQGGVAAKAAVCAMAYANISCTGRLVSKGTDGPGFYLVGDYGVGLEAGAGIQMFVKVGLEYPRRMIGNCSDIAVDNTLKLIEEEIRESDSGDVKKAIEMLWGLRAPAKIAIRTAFETGVALSEDPNFRIKASDVSSELAKRCVHIAIEEAQPYILELILKWAMNQLRVQLGFDEAAWDELLKDTDSVANLLENMPDDPFGTEGEDKLKSNLKYWSTVILGFEKLRGDVSQDKSDLEFYLSMVWGAVQLSFIVSHYSKKKRSRKGTETAIEPIESIMIKVELIPPTAVNNFILEKLNQRNQSKVSINQLLQFFSLQITENLDTFIVPNSSTYDIFNILSGGEIKGDIKDVISQVINSIASSDSIATNLITVDSIQKGLKWYMTQKVEKELSVVIERSVKNGLLKNMLNEVLIKSLAYTTDQIITCVRTYDANDKTLIREACSSVLMRLISRSLVVLTDELLAYTMQQTHDTLETIGDGIGSEKSDPIFNKLIKGDSLIDRATAKTIVTEMFKISSHVFSAIEEEKREKARNLIYNLLDGMPSLDQLKNVNNFPGKDQLLELAKHNSEVLKDYVTEFAKQVLAKLGEFILQQITMLVESGKKHVEEWKKYLEEEINKKLIEIKNELVLSAANFAKSIEESIKIQHVHVNGMLDYVIQNKEMIKNELVNRVDEYFKANLKRALYKLASKALNIFGTPLLNIIVEACTQLKNKKDFLEQLQKSKNEEEIAEMLGNKLGELVAAKFKINIATGKKREGWKLITTYSTYGVPTNIVQSVFVTLFTRMEKILELAKKLLVSFNQYSAYIIEENKAKEKEKHTNNKLEKVKKLQEKIPENAQVDFVAPLDKDLALLNADGKIQVQFENVPIQFFGTDSHSVSHVLIWVNNKLIGNEQYEFVEDHGMVIVSIQLSPGPNIVCARIIDGNIETNPLIVFVNPSSGSDKDDSLDSWVLSDKMKWTDGATKKMEVQFKNAEEEILELVINDY